MRCLMVIGVWVGIGCLGIAQQPQRVWPSLAPGETTEAFGEALPQRADEQPPITRIVRITAPAFTVHRPDKPNGSAAIILPGGGFGKVVPDLEGTEAADWLNRLGITAFVLNYRTTQDSDRIPWVPPLQDAQRTLALVRARAEQWNLDPDRIGLVAFSAGGQVAARLLAADGKLSYEAQDEIDEVSHRPNFAVLIYPWQMWDAQQERLVEGISVPEDCPPTFLVHTHDDRSSSLGAVFFYAGLKRHGIPAALHVYGNGGHGYGLRPRQNSQISSWPDHAGHWLQVLEFAN